MQQAKPILCPMCGQTGEIVKDEVDPTRVRARCPAHGVFGEPMTPAKWTHEYEEIEG